MTLRYADFVKNISATNNTPDTPVLVAEDVYRDLPFVRSLASLVSRAFVNWHAVIDPATNKIRKVPRQKTNDSEQHLTLLEALEISHQIGIVCNASHPVVALDLDDLPLTTPCIKALLINHPTYVEHSPSGRRGHFRIFYAVPDKAQAHKGKYTIHPHTDPLYQPVARQQLLALSSPTPDEDTPTHGHLEVFLYSGNYVTLTGAIIKHPRAVPTITEISLATLAKYLPSIQIQESQLGLTVHTQTPPTHQLSSSPPPPLEYGLNPVQEALQGAPQDSIQLMDNLAFPSRLLAEIEPTQLPADEAEHYEFLQRVLKQAPIALWLTRVPCREDDPRVIRYCTLHKLSYYQYWLHGLMALHATLGPINGMIYAMQWSKQDPVKWNEQAFNDTWLRLTQPSTRDDAPKITAASYLYLFRHVSFDWPVVDEKGNANILNYQNWLYFLEFLQLRFYQDAITKRLLIDGPLEVLIPAFFKSRQDQLKCPDSSIEMHSHSLSVLAANYGIQIHPTQVMSHMKSFLAHTEATTDGPPLFRLWLDSLPTYDPITEPDYIDQLWGQAIHTDTPHPDYAQRVQIGRLWLYSLLRGIIPDKLYRPQWSLQGAELMIILYGPQRTGKTTFAKNLLPEEFSYLYTEVTPMTLSAKRTPSSMKDYYQQIAQNLVVNFDEGGFFFGYNQENADFAKQEVTSNTLDFRLPYGRAVVKMRRMHSSLMTTNDASLALPRSGSRRFPVIQVTGIDLDLYNSIPRDRLFKQIEYEMVNYRGLNAPWAPDADLSTYIISYTTTYQKSTNLEALLHELYDFSELGYSARFLELDTVKGALEPYLHTPLRIREIAQQHGVPTSLKEVKYTLKHLGELYHPFSSGRVKRSRVNKGIFARTDRTLYVLPIAKPTM